MKTTFFSICDFQDALGEELKQITYSATGNHVKRSRGAAMRKAIIKLEKKGYTSHDAHKIVRDAYDMAILEMLCDEAA